MDMNERIATIKFHQRLLAKVISEEKTAFYQLVIEKDLTEEEMLEVIQLVKQLQEQLEEQKEMGYVHFSSLLIHFAGMLNPKLKPYETLKALEGQEICLSLIQTLLPYAREAMLADEL